MTTIAISRTYHFPQPPPKLTHGSRGGIFPLGPTALSRETFKIKKNSNIIRSSAAKKFARLPNTTVTADSPTVASVQTSLEDLTTFLTDGLDARFQQRFDQQDEQFKKKFDQQEARLQKLEKKNKKYKYQIKALTRTATAVFKRQLMDLTLERLGLKPVGGNIKKNFNTRLSQWFSSRTTEEIHAAGMRRTDELRLKTGVATKRSKLNDIIHSDAGSGEDELRWWAQQEGGTWGRWAKGIYGDE